MTLVNAETGEIVAPCSEDQARALTEAIRSSASRTWVLLEKAHRDAVHVALGYGSWSDYCRSEFDMTKQNAYLLLDQARVIGELAESSALDPSSVHISGRAAQDIKGDLPALSQRIAERTADEVPAGASAEVETETKRRIIEEEVERTRQTKKAPPPVKSFDPGRDDLDDEPEGIDLDEDLADEPEPAPLTPEEQRAVDIEASDRRAARALETVIERWSYLRSWLDGDYRAKPYLSEPDLVALAEIEEWTNAR